MAFSERMAWEVRTTGSESNSGGFRGGWSITPPAAPVLSNAGGSALAPGTYYFVLTYAQLGGSSDSGGKGTLESPHSAESSITLGGSAQVQITSPTNPLAGDSEGRGKGDVAYCVYAGTVSGGPYHPVNSGSAGSNTFSANSGTNITLTQDLDPQVDDYGPPGIDYTQQNGVQITYTDLVIDGANNKKLTSVAHPGTSDLVGNTINVTSGTGFTVQRVEILNVDGSGAYYVDKSAGTLGSTAGQAKLGGALASPGLAGAQLEIGADSGVIFIKNGTYTLSGTANVSGGRVRSDSNNCHIIGYDTTRTTYNRDSNRPTLQAGADSMVLVTLARNYSVAANLQFSGNGHSSVTGIRTEDRNCLIRRCRSTTCNPGFDSSADTTRFIFCLSDGDSGTGFSGNGKGTLCFACVANVQTHTGFVLEGAAYCVHCVAYVSGGTGFDSDASGNLFVNCTARDMTGALGSVGFATNNAGTGIESTFINCEASDFAGAGSAGFTFGVSLPSDLLLACAGYNNTVDLFQVWGVNIEGFTHLTQDPFVNAAGLDFGLNNVMGGGRSLRGAGVPGHASLTQLPNLVADSYVDIGAVQTSSQQTGMLVHPGMTGGMRA